MTRSRGNDWNRMYGAQRRAKDRKLLEELERQIASEEGAYGPSRLDALAARRAEAEREGREAREAIARAFGRPAD